MIQMAPGTKVHLACRPVSMRYGFDGLSAKKLSRIGSDEREVLEYVPSHFKVVVHVRPKMS